MINLQHYGHIVQTEQMDESFIRSEESRIESIRKQISEQRAESVLERIHARNRLIAEQRVRKLCDPETSIWFLGGFCGYADSSVKKTEIPWQMGVICAVGTVCGRQAVIIANDNTVAAGSWWPGTPEKIEKAQDMALRLGIPVFYLIECAGLYLPSQEQTYGSSTGAGRIFEKQAQLNRSGILQLAAVLGDCIAGGGYLPLLCDKIVMTEQATICIGGTAIHTHSKGSCDQKLGGPEIHVHQSGCVDKRVKNDLDAIAQLREWAEIMPTSSIEFFRWDEPVEPAFDIQDLYHLIPADLSKPLDMYEVLARLVDGSQFQPLMEGIGREIIACLAFVDGLPVVIVTNQTDTSFGKNEEIQAGSILYQDGITKMRMIAAAARDDGIPVIWIQDVAGFDIGLDAERRGLLKHGAMLLRELAAEDRDTAPSLTILLRKASGAGYYAMKGAPFHPAWIVGTVLTRLEVMKPEVLAGAFYDRKIARLDGSEECQQTRLKLESARQEMIEKQTLNGDCLSAAIRGDIDDIVPFCRLRELMVSFARSAYQTGGKSRKPRRLWSILDLNET